MKKPTINAVIGLVVLSIGALYFFNNQKSDQAPEQAVLEQTLAISKKYAALRYRTDNVLINAKEYNEYDLWNKEITDIISQWKGLEKDAATLEKTTSVIAEEKISVGLVSTAYAYDKQEISNIIDKAPMGKKIMTLAKHLGVDAKRAQLILNQDQAQVTSDAWNEAGNTFQTLENSAVNIKNGSKVTVFVGTLVATGGTSAFVASGALAQTAVVVSGADLVLEVSDDEARIALGDRNKVSKMISKVRAVTEPAAGILSIASIPGNVSKAIDKFGVAYLGADQIRSVVQDEKILGVSIKINEKGETKTEIAGLSEDELSKWKEENNAPDSTETAEEIIEQAVKVSTEASKKERVEEKAVENKKESIESRTVDIPNQIYKIVNVSGSSYMMDVCHTPTCWDDLAAKPEEDRDIGGIYTLGKVFGNGESFKHGFRPADLKNSGRLEETSANSYKITVYFAIAPFEGPKNKTIDYGTWLSESVEINAIYGDEPVIEWDGSSLKQVK